MSAPAQPASRRRWPWFAGGAILLAVIGAGWWFGKSRSQEAQAKRAPPAVTVTTAKAESRDVAVRVKANGIVTALQSVDLRSQVTSTVRDVHIREGQAVAKGDLLFSLDAREAEANLKKAEAQIEKDRADLTTAKRNLERQQELYRQKFISQSALDVVQNQVDTLSGQLAVDTAAAERANATGVPAQAVQTGPENRFVFVVGEDKKAEQKPVTLSYVEEGFAVVKGVSPGARIVVEGAQNLRPGSIITEGAQASDKA